MARAMVVDLFAENTLAQYSFSVSQHEETAKVDDTVVLNSHCSVFSLLQHKILPLELTLAKL